MKPRNALIAVILVGMSVVACSESPTDPDSDLVGLWNLPFQEEPAIFGLVSAQVIFRADHTFSFTGLNPMSMGPLRDFTVTGTWTRAAESITLDAGDDPRTFDLEFDAAGVWFTERGGTARFHLFRPLPD